MLKSMTAFGRAESLQSDEGFIVEIRSVNYRFRDIIVHLSHNLKALEGKIREMISSSVERGRIEVSVQRKNDNVDRGVQLKLNRPLLKSYITVFNELNRELGTEKPLDLAYFYQLKDVITVIEENCEVEELWPDLKVMIEQAMLSFDNMKKNEGRAIEKDFLDRLEKIAKYINEIRERSKETVKDYAKKLKQSIKDLIKNIEINNDRLFQEVAFMAEKSDITEELVRMESHLKQFKDFMKQDNAVGRKLDFLLQELHREINTIGSKASDSTISHYVVEVKAELEKLREQIQNIE